MTTMKRIFLISQQMPTFANISPSEFESLFNAINCYPLPTITMIYHDDKLSGQQLSHYNFLLQIYIVQFNIPYTC